MSITRTAVQLLWNVFIFFKVQLCLCFTALTCQYTWVFLDKFNLNCSLNQARVNSFDTGAVAAKKTTFFNRNQNSKVT